MIKITFWLKKSDNEQGSLEQITVGNPKKVSESKLAGLYACEVYLPILDMEKKQHLIYAGSPIEALCIASEFAKDQLQFFLNRGSYTINEVESHEPWKLAKKDPQIYLQEKIKAIKDDKNISQEGKDKILVIMKENFGKIPHMKDKFD